jgi:hypothetical protein
MWARRCRSGVRRPRWRARWTVFLGAENVSILAYFRDPVEYVNAC